MNIIDRYLRISRIRLSDKIHGFAHEQDWPISEPDVEDDRRYGRNQAAQGGKFQLPSEAQWEYACRAGSATHYCFGEDASGLGEYAWYGANSDSRTHPVGREEAERLGAV